VDVTGTITL